MNLANFEKLILSAPRAIKQLMVLVLDIIACLFTVWVAFYLRLGEFLSISNETYDIITPSILSVLLSIPIFIYFGLYQAIFRYAGWPSLLTISKAIALYGAIYATIITGVGIRNIPRTIGLIQPLQLLFLIGCTRAFARFWLGGLYKSRALQHSLPKTLIYGAGSAGRKLANALQNSSEITVLGYLDDNSNLHDRVINGLVVYDPNKAFSVIKQLSVSDILLALPSVNRSRRNEIIAKVREFNVKVRTLPGVSELVQGKVSVSDLHELDIDDLLCRDIINPDPNLLIKDIKDKTVLVTGAGGSIGSELCRQILEGTPRTLILFEHNEFALYNIHQELLLLASSNNISIIPLLGSTSDEFSLTSMLSIWRPETMYHVAAYKHVPLVELNVSAAVLNNVFGTLLTAQSAIKFGVKKFVLISTDKAVRPKNVMGASKRLAELILQALAESQSNTVFSMVRFGNVLDSSGSVVPHFRKQIFKGGPLTVTHPEVNRFFMTITEAAQLVIQAGALANNGDLFFLDMGEPINIIDLAKKMIELSGLTVKDDSNPYGDIAIEITGLRPGEKLYEELLIGENPVATDHPRIFRAREEFIPYGQLALDLEELRDTISDQNIDKIIKILQKLVSGFSPSKVTSDLHYNAITQS